MSPVSRYGRLYSRGAYSDRLRTILAVAIVVLLFLLFLGWPEGAMHDKRIAVGVMTVFLILLALHIL